MSTSLILSQNRAETPREENDVRSTTNVVREDAPSAVADHTPQFNETDIFDPETEGGLTDRNLYGHVVPSQQYVPAIGNANTDFGAPIDSQISTAGTAPARESAGEWGHGSMQIVESIEPTIREGGAMGNDYFSAQTRQIQRGMRTDLVGARNPDGSDAASDQQVGKTAARDAANAALYARFLEQTTQ